MPQLQLPIFPAGLTASQLIGDRTVHQGDIVEAFQVPLATVKRYIKVHRDCGAEGFFRQPRRRGATVLTAEMQQRAQQLLDEGKSVPELAVETKVKANTLHKAIRAGRLHSIKKKS
jgi:hypothetical protein